MTRPFSCDMEQSLHDQLVRLLHKFDLSRALRLSDQLQAYESDGGVVGPVTDRMWLRLTDKIIAAKRSSWGQ